ncbi:hypothetical protein STCU_06508 [Strigomonas culicis]|uniref:Dynein regulatory complex subunit 2 n=1 Tax=Strigomonas culicis TaxID=28005 RepID=S9VRB8_9TRYP|nr:hypothetical protein STCU_06508 [Strigomonas culicis]|eukprot:EPY25735.1 hypothetical protein STCU_06508 [Strigomonas culicis]
MPVKKSKKSKKAVDPIALEKKRAEEAEKKRRENAMLQARLQEIIEEEKSMSETASSSIEARWIKFLRECKQKKLITQIEILKRVFEATVDRKNAVVEALLQDIEETEQQYRQAFHSHIDVVDSLIALQERHIDDLEKEFESDLLDMKVDFELERAELSRNHDAEMADLRLILDNMAREAEEMEKKLQEETSEAHETATEKMDEEKKQIQADLTRTTDGVRSELDTRYKEFMSNAQVNMKDYVDKSKEDQMLTERIALQLKKIDKLQESVGSWRTNISRGAREWEQRNSAIQAERESTLNHLKALKHEWQIWRQKQAKELAELVKDAKETDSSLESTTKRAERILRLVELCRPLETEREQVLSLESEDGPQAVEAEVKRRVAAAEPGSLEDQSGDGNAAVGADWQYMERFWNKYNKVVLDNAAIAQERHHLEQENQQLQLLLKNYFDDISVNDNVMSSSNALLRTTKAGTAKNVVQAATSSGKDRLFNTVIEGNKVVNDAARQQVRY